MAILEIYTIGVYDYKNLSFAEMSNELAKYSIETIKNNPKEYFKQVITKSWLDFWRPSIALDNQGFKSGVEEKVFDSVWFVQRKFFNIFKYGFILLVPFYLYRFFKNKIITNQFILVTIVFATSVLQGLVTYGTNARYSFPFEYIMIFVGIIFIKNHLKLPFGLNKFFN